MVQTDVYRLRLIPQQPLMYSEKPAEYLEIYFFVIEACF